MKMMRGLGIPNAFTPNGDGKNDVFRIPTSSSITLKEFVIYDRWGTRIFSTKDPSVGWDGTFKGAACPSSTYAYIISGTSSQGEFMFKGVVVLVR
ncbi:MAG: gliding motility-associated C-terminal domain-containing protein [Chitinophagaceae bacterium]|nr:gliding motility-associated C-terminal domain-containing protein [Chitinophagaceae bacterium]